MILVNIETLEIFRSNNCPIKSTLFRTYILSNTLTSLFTLQ